ncbi:MAG: rod shape-determining protein, partial [Acidobacteriota bacterium]
MPVQVLINLNILGQELGQISKHSFQPIIKDRINIPDYNAKFFETFPTVWAQTYAFRRLLEERNHRALEEWGSLLLLHYFRVAHLDWLSSETLRNKYDRHLWPALIGTYPLGDSRLTRIGVLKLNDGTVIGGYFEPLIFFPARGRSDWHKSTLLSPYLEQGELCWPRIKQQFLTNNQRLKEFYEHLKSLAYSVLEGEYKKLLNYFYETVETSFQSIPDISLIIKNLSSDPNTWGNNSLTPDQLLAKYPLRKPTADGKGYVYYLLDGLTQLSTSMTTPIEAGLPSPIQYTRASDSEISIIFDGKTIRQRLGNYDSIVLIKDLLIEKPYWCKVAKNSDTHGLKVNIVNRIDASGYGGIWSVLNDDEIAICLTPLKQVFFEHFPETMERPSDHFSATLAQYGEGVDWKIMVIGFEIKVSTSPIISKDLPNLSLALWPPKVSEKWHLYVAEGAGVKKSECGRLALIDEQGKLGKIYEIEGDVYVSVLNQTTQPNRPKALTLFDASDTERGILFPLALPEHSPRQGESAALAVDFGTSNTCLAYQVDEGSKPLLFSLKPAMLWGKQPPENPGYVPFEWSGTKGFFPSILLVRKRALNELEQLRVDQLQPHHLFKVDIPGLHKGLENRLTDGSFTHLWETYTSMKWQTSENLKWAKGAGIPARRLFLATILLYAHADLYFQAGAVINNYVATFPLALDDPDTFHTEMQATIRQIRTLCYPANTIDDCDYHRGVDESLAIASGANIEPSQNEMQVFVDVGGGTADIAIRHNRDILVLDSVKVAGNTFFHFAKQHFENTRQLHGADIFKKHLANLLKPEELAEFHLTRTTFEVAKLKLPNLYSLLINGLDDLEFKQREREVLMHGMGRPSYQLYRATLFFRHLLTYTLIQGCAAVVDNEVIVPNGFRLILSGNGWGLLMFAELRRAAKPLLDEAEDILKRLKKAMLPTLSEEKKPYLEQLRVSGVELLNERDLSNAKTSVAKGALKLLPRNGGREPGRVQIINGNATPYTGITIEQVKINKFNPTTVHWYDRWGTQYLCAKIDKKVDEFKHLEVVVANNNHHTLLLLSIFTCLG